MIAQEVNLSRKAIQNYCELLQKIGLVKITVFTVKGNKTHLASLFNEKINYEEVYKTQAKLIKKIKKIEIIATFKRNNEDIKIYKDKGKYRIRIKEKDGSRTFILPNELMNLSSFQDRKLWQQKINDFLDIELTNSKFSPFSSYHARRINSGGLITDESEKRSK